MHDFIEFLLGGFPSGLANRPRTTRDIHQNINPPAKACAGFLHCSFAGGTRGDVAGNYNRFRPKRAGFSCHGFNRRDITTNQRKPAAFARKGQCDGSTHPLCRAGNDRNAPLQI